MKIRITLLFAGLLASLLANDVCGQRAQRATSPPANGGEIRVPNGLVVKSSLEQGARIPRDRETRFTITARDPWSGPISIVPTWVPRGMVFDPVQDAPALARVEATWTPIRPGFTKLGFLVTSGAGETLFTLEVHVVEQPAYVAGDVTGDGHVDLVVPAAFADVGGVPNAGAIQVFAGPDPGGSPLATLTVPGAGANDWLGRDVGVFLMDLTGDGIADVVTGSPHVDTGGTTDAGALYLWAGGNDLSGAVAPTARLVVPGAAALDSLGLCAWFDSLLFDDVTGDGRLDLIAGAPFADVGSSVDAGAWYVWAGGASFAGDVVPSATLTVPGAAAGDQLGWFTAKLADVTGDGTRDVVLASMLTDVGSVGDAGAIHVFAGGAGLSGAVAPTASLTDPQAAQDDRLVVSGLLLADVTGDGLLDVISASSFTNTFSGALYVWAGGPGLTGSPAPTVLDDPSAPGGFLGFPWLLGDVNGDGVLDLISAAMEASVDGVSVAGRLYTWFGGPGLPALTSPSAVLTLPDPVAGDRVGSARLADVTADGVLDVIGASDQRSENGVSGSGAFFVWAGGAGFASGSPTATLAVSSAQPGDFLSKGEEVFDDVTGDGRLDLVAGAVCASQGSVSTTGAVYVWSGDPALAGTVFEMAALSVPGGASNDRLSEDTLAAVDVTGDGLADVVAGSVGINLGGVIDAGALYVWKGGAALAGDLSPTACLTNPTPGTDDFLGAAGTIFLDVTGDGVRDLTTSAVFADVGGVADTGAVFVWAGSPGLSGSPAPAVLAVPGAITTDELGGATPRAIQLVDVSGDGRLDVIGAAPRAMSGGVLRSGALYSWIAGAPWAGLVAPSTTMSVPTAQVGDCLGDLDK